MKQADRFLLGIVAAIILLVVVTLAVALRQPSPTYQPANTPEGVAHNYLLALQQGEYERAYSYLSPTLPGYPANSAAFADTITQYRWIFRFEENTAVSLIDATIIADKATARAAITEFHNSGPFGNDVSTTNFTLQLRYEAGGWKIWQAERYWMGCWNRASGCDAD